MTFLEKENVIYALRYYAAAQEVAEEEARSIGADDLAAYHCREASMAKANIAIFKSILNAPSGSVKI